MSKSLTTPKGHTMQTPMIIAPAAPAAKGFEPGDVVWGQPVFEGKVQPRRKGIVLGFFSPETGNRLVVWWFGLGEASADTCSVMSRIHLTPAGDVFELTARRATQLFHLTGTYFRASAVRSQLRSHALRLKSAGVR